MTRQVVYIHVHYGAHGEMYIGIDSRLFDLSLCCIICSQIKKIRVLVAKPELLISCHPNEWQSVVFPPVDHRDNILAWESTKWADYLAGRNGEWLSALMKNGEVGGSLWNLCCVDCIYAKMLRALLQFGILKLIHVCVYCECWTTICWLSLFVLRSGLWFISC